MPKKKENKIDSMRPHTYRVSTLRNVPAWWVVWVSVYAYPNKNRHTHTNTNPLQRSLTVWAHRATHPADISAATPAEHILLHPHSSKQGQGDRGQHTYTYTHFLLYTMESCGQSRVSCTALGCRRRSSRTDHWSVTQQPADLTLERCLNVYSQDINHSFPSVWSLHSVNDPLSLLICKWWFCDQTEQHGAVHTPWLSHLLWLLWKSCEGQKTLR